MFDSMNIRLECETTMEFQPAGPHLIVLWTVVVHPKKQFTLQSEAIQTTLAPRGNGLLYDDVTMSQPPASEGYTCRYQC
jgi:hypothetical protein